MSDQTPKPRTGPGLRIRCPFDDGTDLHTATDIHGPLDISALSGLVKALGRCACGCKTVVLGTDATEPSEANAARKAHDQHVVTGTVEQHTRVKWKHSGDALRALFADGRERTNSEVAGSLRISYDAVSQLLRRSAVVERVRPGMWRLRAQEGADQ